MQWQEFRSHIRHLPTIEIARIEQAFELGKKMHAGQKRKSGEDYFTHPIAVAHMLADMLADADTLIAALLHDTVEDTSLTLDDIKNMFGEEVSILIDGVTKLDAKEVAMSPKLDEQIESIRKIFTLMQKDVRIMVIKIVDRLHNIQTIQFLKPERQQSLAQETLEVYVKIADKLCMQDLRDELEALCLAVLEPELFPKLIDLRANNEQRGVLIIKDMQAKLRVHDRVLTSHIAFRFESKTWDQVAAQLSAAGAVTTGLSFITIAMECESIDGCYRSLGALHQLWQREVLSFQDFINAPQLNGYQGLHTTIIAEDGTRVRCKIRTHAMNEYSHKGVTTVCFSGISDLEEILPWTKRISSLTDDTQGSSSDFWQNLRGDILGESITIHGPGDFTAQLPSDATALDGAFYLLKQDALKTLSIKVNGKETLFSERLSNAASLDIMLSEKETCSLDWLKQVQTGFSAAIIRSELAKQPALEKLNSGKALLQKTFTQRKRGFIDEFNEKNMKSQLATIGLSSLNDMYISIADGRLEPDEAYEVLFENKKKKRDASHALALVRYTADMNSTETMDRLNAVHRTHGHRLSSIYYKRKADGIALVSLHADLQGRELNAFIESLETAGASFIHTRALFETRVVLLILLLVLLWGLDAVMTKEILLAGVAPAAFTILRSWSVAAFAFLALVFIQSPKTLLLIPIRHRLLWISGISFFLINLLTNYTLSEVSPFFYKTSLRMSAPLLALPVLLEFRKRYRNAWCLALLGAGLLLLLHFASSTKGMVLSVAMTIAFVVYTEASAAFQKRAQIDFRYPQFFLAVCVIAALLSPVLFLFGPVPWPTPSLILAVVAFSGGFVCIPYLLFYYLHRKLGYHQLSPFFHLSIGVTFIAEWFALGIFDGWLLIPCGAFILASALTPPTSELASEPA